jgi:mevalonate kinase
MQRVVAQACGKIIISGNVALRFGKRALAVPVDLHVTAIWDKSDTMQEGLRIVWSGHKQTSVWLITVRKIIKLLEIETGPLWGKLLIRNSLPLGKGMGSSTAIVVALARCFLGQDCKDAALRIEDTINKGHSGIDFAAIWEERPVLISNGKYEFIDLPEPVRHGYLVDTGFPVEPTSLIIKHLDERSQTEKILIDSVEKIGDCTDRLLSGEDPQTVFPDHHVGQVNLGVVPPRVRSLIEKIQQSGGAAKATRSGIRTGGSGMVFAVHPEFGVLERLVGKPPIALLYDPARRRFLTDPHPQGHRTTPKPQRRIRRNH